MLILNDVDVHCQSSVVRKASWKKMMAKDWSGAAGNQTRSHDCRSSILIATPLQSYVIFVYITLVSRGEERLCTPAIQPVVLRKQRTL